VRALDDDHAVDRRVRLAAANLARDLEQLRKREVARGRAPEIDRDEVRDRLDARRPGEDRGAIERRHLATRGGVRDHRDRPAGEDDRDAAHSGFPRSSWRWGYEGCGRLVPVGSSCAEPGTISGMRSGPSPSRIGPRVTIEIMPEMNTRAATVRITAVVPTRSAMGPTMMIGRMLATEMSMFRRSEERRVGKECRSRGSPYH